LTADVTADVTQIVKLFVLALLFTPAGVIKVIMSFNKIFMI
jgi:hypothetical protein